MICEQTARKCTRFFAANAARSNQLEVSLIGDSGRFQRVAGVPAGQLSPGDSPQVRVNGGHQVAQRLFIAIGPGGDQSADVSCALGRHACAILPKKIQ
jgi:hypothetical protein